MKSAYVGLLLQTKHRADEAKVNLGSKRVEEGHHWTHFLIIFFFSENGRWIEGPHAKEASYHKC